MTISTTEEWFNLRSKVFYFNSKKMKNVLLSVSMSYRKLELKNTSQKFRDNIQYLQIALHPLWEKCFVKKYSSITLHCHYLISCYLYFAQADEFPQNNWEECDQLAVAKSGRGRCHLWPGRPETRRYWSPVPGRQPGNYKDGSARPDLSCSMSVNLWRVQW